MAPSNKAEAISYFRDVWAERPEAAIGSVIIEFLASHIESRNLPITTFFDVAKQYSAQENSAIINVINYLSGADLHLLKADFELIENDEIFFLDSDQVTAAQDKGVNPKTGEFDPEVTNKIFLCFTPSDMAKKVLRK